MLQIKICPRGQNVLVTANSPYLWQNLATKTRLWCLTIRCRGCLILYLSREKRLFAYVSKTLNKHELNYSQIGKEGLSVIFVLKNFSQYLLENHFILTTDNKAIKKIFNPKTEISSIAGEDLVRRSLMVAQYDYELEFKPTKEHHNADILLRSQHNWKVNWLLGTWLTVGNIQSSNCYFRCIFNRNMNSNIKR